MAEDINFPGNLASVDTIADLRDLASTGLAVDAAALVQGDAAYADNGGGIYVWDSTSLASDDGVYAIKPDDLTTLQAGRWLLVGSDAYRNAIQAIQDALDDYIANPDFTDIEVDSIAVGDAVFKLTLAAGVATITFDTGDSLTYDRAANTMKVKIGTTDRFTLSATAAVLATTLTVGAITTSGAIIRSTKGGHLFFSNSAFATAEVHVLAEGASAPAPVAGQVRLWYDP